MLMNSLKHISMKEKKEITKQLLCFLIITSTISTGIFIWMFSGARDSPAAVIPMMFTPGISAIITALIYKEKLADFGWRLGKARFLLLGFALPILVSVIGYGLIWLSDFSDFSAVQVKNYRWAKYLGFDLPAPFIVGALSKGILGTLMASLIVFGEELGWSGFMTPRLRKLFSIPLTSLIVGVYWAVWHFPAIIGGFYGSDTPLWISLPGFTMVLVGASFIRTVLIEKSKSIWPGVILHASHNIILMSMFLEMSVDGKYVDYLVSETGLFLGLVYILVAVIFWKTQIKIPARD